MFDETKYINSLPFYSSKDETRLIKQKIDAIDVNLPHKQYLEEVENAKRDIQKFIDDEQRKYDDESARLHALFEQDMVDEFNLVQFPFSIIRRIHNDAYEKGHAHGFASIHNYYYDLVEFAEFIMKHARDI